MLFFGKTVIVLIDAQELRRVAFANLFSSLLSGKNVLLLDCHSVDFVKSPQFFPLSVETTAPLFILNTGAVSLSDPQIAREIASLRAFMPRSMVLVMLDADWTGETEVALALGVNGVVCMSMPPQNVSAAIEIALMGGTYFPNLTSYGRAIRDGMTPIANSLVAGATPTLTNYDKSVGATRVTPKETIGEKLIAQEEMAVADPNSIPLSRRQIEVLKTLQSGLSNKEIARRLGLSEATIKIHVRHLMRKFGVFNRTQVAVLSRHNGVISPETSVAISHVPSL